MIKQFEAINAYRKLNEMTDIKLPATISFKVFKLRNRLKELYDWQSGEETRLFAEYQAKFDNDGRIILDNPEQTAEFAEKLNELTNIEHEEFEKVVLPIGAFDMLSMKDIEELSTVIEFTE